MSEFPMVLVSPDIEAKGKEFGDLSVSLSMNYQRALASCGLLPLIMPATRSERMISEMVKKSDGVVLTGGDDIEPSIYLDGLPPRIRKTVEVTPDGGERDFRELVIIKEVFRQQKPLLAICRGHQMVNIALGGTLLADLPSQAPGALNHRRLDRRDEPVHEVQLTPGSVLAKITSRKTLRVSAEI